MNKNRSKMVFANALMDLSNKKALTEITVTDITDYCGLSRTSFYYHFKDKQELIYWVYAAFRDEKLKVKAECARENISEVLNYMQQHSAFFKQAFAETGQNCFKNEYRQSLYQDTIVIIEENNDCAHLDIEDKKLIATFFTNATVDAIEMLLEEPSENIENAVDVLTEILKSSLNVIEGLKAIRENENISA